MDRPRPARPLRWAGLLLAGVLAGCSGVPSSTPADRFDPRPSDPPSCPHAAKGSVVVGHLPSTIIGGMERYHLYVPPYSAGAEVSSLPLLVLLHGSGDDDTQWIDVGAAAAADCLRAQSRAHPLAVVTIDAHRVEQDPRRAGSRTERFITGELLPYLSRRYPQLDTTSLVRIGGISLGGGWALTVASRRPDLFCAVGGHSPSAGGAAAPLRAHGVRVWLDGGTRDVLGERAARTGQRWRAAGLDVQVHRWPGQHDRRYWSHHVLDYLRFYAGACPPPVSR